MDLDMENRICPRCKRHARSVIHADGEKHVTCSCLCGCHWVDPPNLPVLDTPPTARNGAPPKTPRDATCPKCGGGAIEIEWLGLGTEYQTVNSTVAIRAPGPDMLRLTCSCRYSWEQAPLTAEPKPTGSASVRWPDDPMQAHVTLGALRKILDDRGRELIERAKEIVAEECTALVERIRRYQR